jgi:hypothetical protein
MKPKKENNMPKSIKAKPAATGRDHGDIVRHVHHKMAQINLSSMLCRHADGDTFRLTYLTGLGYEVGTHHLLCNLCRHIRVMMKMKKLTWKNSANKPGSRAAAAKVASTPPLKRFSKGINKDSRWHFLLDGVGALHPCSQSLISEAAEIMRLDGRQLQSIAKHTAKNKVMIRFRAIARTERRDQSPL